MNNIIDLINTIDADNYLLELDAGEIDYMDLMDLDSSEEGDDICLY